VHRVLGQEDHTARIRGGDCVVEGPSSVFDMSALARERAESRREPGGARRGKRLCCPGFGDTLVCGRSEGDSGRHPLAIGSARDSWVGGSSGRSIRG